MRATMQVSEHAGERDSARKDGVESESVRKGGSEWAREVSVFQRMDKAFSKRYIWTHLTVAKTLHGQRFPLPHWFH